MTGDLKDRLAECGSRERASELCLEALDPGHRHALSQALLVECIEKTVGLAVIRLRPRTEIRRGRELRHSPRRIERLLLPHDEKQTLHQVEVREELTETTVVPGWLVCLDRTPDFSIRPFHVANQLAEHSKRRRVHGRALSSCVRRDRRSRQESV